MRIVPAVAVLGSLLSLTLFVLGAERLLAALWGGFKFGYAGPGAWIVLQAETTTMFFAGVAGLLLAMLTLRFRFRPELRGLEPLVVAAIWLPLIVGVGIGLLVLTGRGLLA
jgi:hypothetical protein